MSRARRFGNIGVGGRMGAKDDSVVSDTGMDFTLDELREFLEADLLDVDADPDFKERLRRKLWALVQERTQRTTRHEH